MAGVGSALALVAAVVGLYVVLLRDPSAGGLRRRAVLVDGRRRDHDVLTGVAAGPGLLAAVAVVDLAGVVGSAGGAGGPVLSTAVGAGLLLGVLLRVPVARSLVLTAVGAAGLLVSAWQVLAGTGGAQGLGTGTRVGVLLATAAFIGFVAVARLLVAPLRPGRGAEAGGAVLAVYGVLEASVTALAMGSAGWFDASALVVVPVAVVCLLALALGIAVQPLFACSLLGLALVVSDLTVGAATGQVPWTAVLGVLGGLLLVAVAGRAVTRR